MRLIKIGRFYFDPARESIACLLPAGDWDDCCEIRFSSGLTVKCPATTDEVAAEIGRQMGGTEAGPDATGPDPYFALQPGQAWGNPDDFEGRALINGVGGGKVDFTFITPDGRRYHGHMSEDVFLEKYPRLVRGPDAGSAR